MAKDVEYTIKVVVQGESSGTSKTSEKTATNSDVVIETSDQTLNGLNSSLIKAGVATVAVGKSMFNLATSYVGTYTGSSYQQQQVNTALKMGGYALHATYDPIGASVSFLTEITTNFISEKINRDLREAELMYQREKIGYTAKNRSRK